MDDLISRQAAINALDGEFNITGRENAETIRDYINSVNKKLRELPSAERRGRWKELYKNNYKCSACGSWWTLEGAPIESGFDYCPTCGAKMDEVLTQSR